MSNTRYGHTGVGGGNQDQGERKDEGWEKRQGGDESGQPGSRGEPTAEQPGDQDRQHGQTPPGTNTQGGLAGIGEASRRSADRLAAADSGDDGRVEQDEASEGSGGEAG